MTRARAAKGECGEDEEAAKEAGTRRTGLQGGVYGCEYVCCRIDEREEQPMQVQMQMQMQMQITAQGRRQEPCSQAGSLRASSPAGDAKVVDVLAPAL